MLCRSPGPKPRRYSSASLIVWRVGPLAGREQGQGHHAGDARPGVVFHVSPRAVVTLLLSSRTARPRESRARPLRGSPPRRTAHGAVERGDDQDERRPRTSHRDARSGALTGLPRPAGLDRAARRVFRHSACHNSSPRDKTNAVARTGGASGDHDEQHAALLRMLLGSDGGSELLLQSLI